MSVLIRQTSKRSQASLTREDEDVWEEQEMPHCPSSERDSVVSSTNCLSSSWEFYREGSEHLWHSGALRTKNKQITGHRVHLHAFWKKKHIAFLREFSPSTARDVTLLMPYFWGTITERSYCWFLNTRNRIQNPVHARQMFYRWTIPQDPNL